MAHIQGGCSKSLEITQGKSRIWNHTSRAVPIPCGCNGTSKCLNRLTGTGWKTNKQSQGQRLEIASDHLESWYCNLLRNRHRWLYHSAPTRIFPTMEQWYSRVVCPCILLVPTHEVPAILPDDGLMKMMAPSLAWNFLMTSFTNKPASGPNGLAPPPFQMAPLSIRVVVEIITLTQTWRFGVVRTPDQKMWVRNNYWHLNDLAKTSMCPL